MAQIEATETDFNHLQSDELTAGQVDGIAGGIMDLLDNKDPDHSATAVSRDATDEENVSPKEEEETEEAAGEETETDEQETYIIKWQGQEREVTQDELVKLAQQGFDYTQKTQKLSEERDQLAPFMGLAKKIQADPILASQIANYLSGQPQQAQVQQKKFEDPIEQLKWETKQEALAEVRQEMMQHLQPLQRHTVLNAVKADVQRDPDYAVVHQAIIDMVASQPPSIQKTLYLQLDQDPTAYMEAFQHFKQQKASTVTKTTQPAQVVKKTTKAPILDAGGVASGDEVTSRERSQRISKQKAAALRSGDNTAIADWLQSSGAIDHLY